MMARERTPAVVVQNAQRKLPVDLPALQQFASTALDECVREFPARLHLFGALDEIVATIVSDRRIAALHKQFMNIAGPTDVITFEHGEIVMSAEMAARQAKDHGSTTRDELRLYLVHGMLHLLGFDDTTPDAARVMEKTQQTIVERVGAVS
jgi:probable rRNA maturation factor